MAELPGNQTLLSSTGDAFKSSRLERMLSNFASSYKLYWLKGVFDEAIDGNDHVGFKRLAARMVASAWYPVTYFRLNLGANDALSKTVAFIRSEGQLAPDASQNEILGVLENSDDPVVQRNLKSLCHYVPYRLIRPFYEERFVEERRRQGKVSDGKADGLVARFNREDPAGAPYRFADDGEGIEIDPSWALYFRENRHVIHGWLDMRLVSYLQARNPSVPAIPLKIYPPVQRDLSAARKYWEEALADHGFTEVFSGVPFDDAGFDALGPMSVDHFIPWSFVLHDEPWNLAPMFRNTNSSKGDRLPDIGEFLIPFCHQQFDALLTLRGRGRHRKIFESYLSINPAVMEYDRSDAALVSFTDAVSKVVIPLHQIACNQGFPIWESSVDYAYTSI